MVISSSYLSLRRFHGSSDYCFRERIAWESTGRMTDI